MFVGTLAFKKPLEETKQQKKKKKNFRVRAFTRKRREIKEVRADVNGAMYLRAFKRASENGGCNGRRGNFYDSIFNGVEERTSLSSEK